MRSLALLFAVAMGMSISSMACSNNVVVVPPPDNGTGETPTEEPTEEGTAPNGDWAGKPISVRSEGAITIVAKPGAKRVTAEVQTEPLEPGVSPNTQPTPFVTIDDKKKTLMSVECVRAGKSPRGCVKLTVTVPAGSEEMPLPLTITSGEGAVVIEGAITVSGLTLVGKGSVSASIKQATQGATIDVSGGDAVEIAVPADLSADQVVLSSKRIDTAAFPGMVSGKPFGEAGVGVKLLKLQSTGEEASSVVRVKRL